MLELEDIPGCRPVLGTFSSCICKSENLKSVLKSADTIRMAMRPKACMPMCAYMLLPCSAHAALIERMLTMPGAVDLLPVQKSLLDAALVVDVHRICHAP